MLGSYCLPFGRRVGEYMYKFQNISLCWIYAVNNFVSICKLNIYVGVGYSSLGIIFGAVGGRVGKYPTPRKALFVRPYPTIFTPSNANAHM